jgi:hypothetical protein
VNAVYSLLNQVVLLLALALVLAQEYCCAPVVVDPAFAPIKNVCVVIAGPPLLLANSTSNLIFVALDAVADKVKLLPEPQLILGPEVIAGVTTTGADGVA